MNPRLHTQKKNTITYYHNDYNQNKCTAQIQCDCVDCTNDINIPKNKQKCSETVINHYIINY